MYPTQLVLIESAFTEEFPHEIIYIIKTIFSRLHGIGINIYDENTINTLIRYAYQSTYFSHVIFNGTPYFNSKCTYDENCHIHSETLIYPKSSDSLEYVIKKDGSDFDDDHFEHCNLELLEQIDKSDLDKIFLLGYKELSIFNIAGWNDDHRGSNHCKIFLNQSVNITEHNMITMKQFIDMCYQLKSHKWDQWYELFSGITSCDLVDDTIDIMINFDHGS